MISLPPDCADTHSFAKYANEWGTQLGLTFPPIPYSCSLLDMRRKAPHRKPNASADPSLTRVPRTTIAPEHLKLSLEENAYGFLNQSLKHYRKTSRNIQEWPFALLHLVQSLELLLKRVLETINPILIYKDIDQPNPDRHTVSLEQALRRLENLRAPIEEKERILIAKAALKRNLVVHYKVELNKFEWKQLYAQLFEFLHFFHHKHLKSDLHSHVVRENWNVEARLMEFFKQNFVIYHGIEVHKGHPKDIIAAQRTIGFSDGKQDFYRIKYGDESPRAILFGWGDVPCGDCGVIKGQYHTDGCDLEECPKCHGQALGCPCTRQFKFELTHP